MAYINRQQQQQQQPSGQRQPHEVRVPFVRQGIGAGDVIKKVTGFLGIEPCQPCEQRAAWLNSRLRFGPRR